ncbi:hypothetical protein K8I85_11495, partial [bacterium]|nr:hypothetical protein [bacterium]
MSRLSVRTLSLSLSLSLSLLVLPGSASAQSYACGHDESPGSAPAGPGHFLATDTVSAIVLFARFPDGADVHPNGSPMTELSCGYSGWSDSQTHPPDWALTDIIEATVPPTVPSSITSFYYEMSGGKHVLTGSTFDSVFVAPRSIAYYDSAYQSIGPDTRASQYANQDLLEAIDPVVDFSGIDLVFIYWHSVRSSDGSMTLGVRSDGVPYAGISYLVVDPITLDDREFDRESGVTMFSMIATCNSTNYKIRHPWTWLGLAAHEYGHDIVPQALPGSVHITTPSRFGIMHGTTAPASLMMSPVVRIELGWLEPDSIDCSVARDDTTITLSSNTFGASAYRVLTTDDPDQSFILQGLQRNQHPYMTRQPDGIDCLPPNECGTAKTIIAPSGLIITHAKDHGTYFSEMTRPPWIDIEVATGKFDPVTGAPDPISGWDKIEAEQVDMPWNSSASDAFFELQSTVTFAPYTNPSSALYRGDPIFGTVREQDVYSGIVVHDVSLNVSGRTVTFRISSDGGAGGPGPDTLRADTTWKGLVQLTGDVVVAGAATLTIAEGCLVVAATKDRHETGVDSERVEIEVLGAIDIAGTVGDNVIITSTRDNTFVHYGGSEAAGTVSGEVAEPGEGNWYGVRLPNGDTG